MSQSTGLELAIELSLWATPTALATAAALRAPRGARAAWWLVAGAGATITADKALDLHTQKNYEQQASRTWERY